eukprot:3723059-Pleurochrysis_carterae.AAC.3
MAYAYAYAYACAGVRGRARLLRIAPDVDGALAPGLDGELLDAPHPVDARSGRAAVGSLGGGGALAAGEHGRLFGQLGGAVDRQRLARRLGARRRVRVVLGVQVEAHLVRQLR